MEIKGRAWLMNHEDCWCLCILDEKGYQLAQGKFEEATQQHLPATCDWIYGDGVCPVLDWDKGKRKEHGILWTDRDVEVGSFLRVITDS